MHYVSDEFLKAIQSNSRQSYISGYLILNNGDTIELSNKNIVSGSLSIDNYCTNGQEISVGSMIMGQLSISIYTDIDRYTLSGGIIKLTYNLKTAGSIYESVGLGTWSINEATRSGKHVSIVAYDNMLLLDTSCTQLRSGVTPYDLLVMISENTGVGLAQTQEEIDEMCAKDSEGYILKIGIKNDNDISTYRDLLYYISQLLGGFATIDRYGKIKICRFHKTADVEIAEDIRTKSTFSDYKVKISGLSISVTGNVTKEQRDNDIDKTIETINNEISLLDEEYAEKVAENEIAEENAKNEVLKNQTLTDEQKQARIEVITTQYLNKNYILKQEYTESKNGYLDEIENLKKQKEESSVYTDIMFGDSSGTVLKLAENPLLFYGTLDTKRKLVANMAEAVIGLEYTPCNMSIFENPLLELGDMINCTGYSTGGSILSVITKYTFKYHAGETIESAGKEITKQTKTSADRQKDSTATAIANATMHVNSFRNQNEIKISNTLSLLASLELAMSADATPMATGQAVLNVTTAGNFKLLYELNGVLHTFTPRQRCEVGYYTLNLFSVLENVKVDSTNKFNVYLLSEDETIEEIVKETVEEKDEDGNITEKVVETVIEKVVHGEATIMKQDVFIALFGSNITKSDEWNGELELHEDYIVVQGVLDVNYGYEFETEMVDVVKTELSEAIDLIKCPCVQYNASGDLIVEFS